MLSVTLLTALTLSAAPALAQSTQDRWGDPHEKLHWIAATGFGALSSHYIDNQYLAYGVGLLPMIAREEWKKSQGFSHYQPSRNVAALVGVGLGVAGDHWIIRPYFVGYKTSF